jgi:hypothetical protein
MTKWLFISQAIPFSFIAVNTRIHSTVPNGVVIKEEDFSTSHQ